LYDATNNIVRVTNCWEDASPYPTGQIYYIKFKNILRDTASKPD